VLVEVGDVVGVVARLREVEAARRRRRREARLLLRPHLVLLRLELLQLLHLLALLLLDRLLLLLPPVGERVERHACVSFRRAEMRKYVRGERSGDATSMCATR
jgi:hypothetical protein